MLIDWSALPGGPTAVESGAVPEHFGRLADEISAINDPRRLTVAVTDYAIIRCLGPDAADFLHNQFTSDVKHLAPGQWQHSAWCTAKGRMLANFMLIRASSADEFDLCIPKELVPAIVKRLKMFVLRSKVQISDLSEDHVIFGLYGERAPRQLETVGLPVPQAPAGVVPFGCGWMVRAASDRFVLCLPAGQMVEIVGRIAQDAVLAGTIAWKSSEIASGIPVIRVSTQEEFVPQMVNFDKLGGVSFHKGCYPGQEVVARTQYLGKVKRHLYRFHASSALQPGDPLYADGDPSEGIGACGTIANVAPSPHGGWDGLAVILEGAATQAIHAGAPNGPTVSNINLVAA